MPLNWYTKVFFIVTCTSLSNSWLDDWQLPFKRLNGHHWNIIVLASYSMCVSFWSWWLAEVSHDLLKAWLLLVGLLWLILCWISALMFELDGMLRLWWLTCHNYSHVITECYSQPTCMNKIYGHSATLGKIIRLSVHAFVKQQNDICSFIAQLKFCLPNHRELKGCSWNCAVHGDTQHWPSPYKAFAVGSPEHLSHNAHDVVCKEDVSRGFPSWNCFSLDAS